MRDVLRRCRFAPYTKGAGPTFALTTWYTGRTDRTWGKSILGYRLTMREPGDKRGRTLFEGEDFATPDCIDDDKCVASLMGFLTLRPGETDSEYFERYTPAQLDYAAKYAEALACECIARFGEI